MTLDKNQKEVAESGQWDFSDLSAIFLNCTLKKSPELSHTEVLMNIPKHIMEKNGASLEVIRPVDYTIASGVYPDMNKNGWTRDDWPEISEV